MDLVEGLLIKDPSVRLGTPPEPEGLEWDEFIMHGAFYVKEHPFFTSAIAGEDAIEPAIDWDLLLQQKAR